MIGCCEEPLYFFLFGREFQFHLSIHVWHVLSPSPSPSITRTKEGEERRPSLIPYGGVWIMGKGQWVWEMRGGG
jgi:hypothetical protein